MKHSLIRGFAGLLALGAATAQIVVPASPKKFVTRPIGGNTSGGVDVIPHEVAPEAKVRYVTHMVLSDDRQWTSADGKPLLAKLIAFEDLVAEAPKGAAQPTMPAPPATPTVIRGGKIRLAADKKIYELALDRLSQPDRDFVEQIRTARAKKPDAAKP